ncbi:substrate-binding domain-containing protein [Alsobacter sp. R-9]
MSEQLGSYLTTAQAAKYLHLKERKLYELVAEGGIPCSKVTGKWLFPRAALDRWIESGMSRPDGMAPAPTPPIVGGSHDPLLEWAIRRSGCGLAMLPEGSEAGLARLDHDEVAVAAIHCHDATGDEDANVRAVASRSHLHDCVLIALARREQGLVLGAGAAGVASLADAVRRRLSFGLRQRGAGAQLLLTVLLERAGMTLDDVQAANEPFPTGADLAAAIRAGDVDCGIASRAVATGAGLGFLPLAWERFDLAMRRRTYFEPGLQLLLETVRNPAFAAQASRLGGYDVADAGRVRLNR